MKHFRFNHDEKGFTLVELMIVVAIIGILAAIAIPNFISYRNRAYCSAMQTDGGSIAGAVADYFAVPTNLTVSSASGPIATAITNLSGTPSNGATVVQAANGTVTITITDASGRCNLTTGGSSTFVKTI